MRSTVNKSGPPKAFLPAADLRRPGKSSKPDFLVESLAAALALLAPAKRAPSLRSKADEVALAVCGAQAGMPSPRIRRK